MSIFKFEDGQFFEVKTTSFIDESILERQHLQQALKNNIQIVAPNCLVIAEEYAEWDASRKRIDLLAIDKNANFVIIELKRTDTGDHMELQAIRYASMISTMTLDHALDVFTEYQKRNGKQDFTKSEAQQIVSEFVSVDLTESSFGDDVRIVLVSSNFSKELTTSVIWLNERDIDITCVKMQPYKHMNNILVNIQQIIPLPEAKDYQIKAQKKTEERREVKKSVAKDYSKYLFNQKELNKRKLVLELIQTHIRNTNVDTFQKLLKDFPQELRDGKLYKPYEEIINTSEELRYFTALDEVLNFSDGKYVISNQWGSGNIQPMLDQADIFGYEIVLISNDISIVEEAHYDHYIIQQLSNLSIRVFENNISQDIVKPILKKIAEKININMMNSKGNEKNTRTLGIDVIKKINSINNWDNDA